MFNQLFRSYLHFPSRYLSIKIVKKSGGKKKQVDSERLVNSADNTSSNKSVEKPKKTPKKRKSNATRVKSFFDTKSYMKDIKSRIPEEYLRYRRSSTFGNLYLMDPLVAKRIVDLIKPTFCSTPDIIIESSPGLGLITKELLESKVPVVRLYETCPKFRKSLQDLIHDHPGRLELFNKDIFTLWRLAYQDRIDNCNRVGQILKGISIKKWNEDPSITIIGVMQDLSFLKYLLFSLVTHSDIVLYGRTELYVTMAPKLYQHIIATPNDNYYLYRGYSVLFQLLFEFEHLGTFPRKAFVPWESVKKLKNKEATPTDTENLYLVRCNFKKEFDVPSEQLILLYHFVRQCMSSRKTKVIAHLEKWVPNAGLKLMLIDINRNKKINFSDLTIFTQFGELSSQQFLHLFREFISWPEVAESPFMASVEDTLIKLTTHPDQVATMHIVEDSERENIEEPESKVPEVKQVDVVKKLVNE